MKRNIMMFHGIYIQIYITISARLVGRHRSVDSGWQSGFVRSWLLLFDVRLPSSCFSLPLKCATEIAKASTDSANKISPKTDLANPMGLT